MNKSKTIGPNMSGESFADQYYPPIPNMCAKYQIFKFNMHIKCRAIDNHEDRQNHFLGLRKAKLTFNEVNA